MIYPLMKNASAHALLIPHEGSSSEVRLGCPALPSCVKIKANHQGTEK